MKNFFKKHIRRDNWKFVLRLLASLLGFIITNFALISFNNFANPVSIVCLIICIGCFVVMMLLIYYKYQYYNGLAKHLQKNNNQLFSICSYISKSKLINRADKKNNFKIVNMSVIYDINVPAIFTGDETHMDFTVTYKITATNNGRTCSKIYYTSLSHVNTHKSIPQIKFDGEDWKNMRSDMDFKLDNNLDLWYGVKSGNPIAHGETQVKYSIKSTYAKGYNILKSNCFLVYPSNYGTHVRKISIIIRAKGEELSKLIEIPTYTIYFNGLNYDERNGILSFEKEDNDNYKTYYTAEIVPRTDDSAYVLELSPKHN